MKPPSHLDSARVLYWAWSGDQPFGKMQIAHETVIEIYGFAICLLDGSLYRFSCDRNWDVQNDTDFQTIEEAMKASFPQYREQPIQWNKFDDIDLDALMAENQRVKYYREVGERRIIQKIIDYLKKHACTGMWVQSTANGAWVLWILKKDIRVASEIAKTNVENEPDTKNGQMPEIIYWEE